MCVNCLYALTEGKLFRVCAMEAYKVIRVVAPLNF